jgi:hypothetical protein
MLHVTRVARFGWLDSSIHSYACSLVHSELSWWGLKLYAFTCCTYALLQSLQRLDTYQYLQTQR